MLLVLAPESPPPSSCSAPPPGLGVLVRHAPHLVSLLLLDLVGWLLLQRPRLDVDVEVIYPHHDGGSGSDTILDLALVIL